MGLVGRCGPSEAFAELVCGQRGLGAANANLRNGDRRVGLKAGVCSGSLAALVENTPRVSSRVTVKIITLHVLHCFHTVAA